MRSAKSPMDSLGDQRELEIGKRKMRQERRTLWTEMAFIKMENGL